MIPAFQDYKILLLMKDHNDKTTVYEHILLEEEDYSAKKFSDSDYHRSSI